MGDPRIFHTSRGGILLRHDHERGRIECSDNVSCREQVLSFTNITFLAFAQPRQAKTFPYGRSNATNDTIGRLFPFNEKIYAALFCFELFWLLVDCEVSAIPVRKSYALSLRAA